jgi:hypothetical protein
MARLRQFKCGCLVCSHAGWKRVNLKRREIGQGWRKRESAATGWEGTPDQTVFLERMRDGQSVQLVVPGGTLEAELMFNGFHVSASFVPYNFVE